MQKSQTSFFRWAELFLGMGGVLLLIWIIHKIGFPNLRESLVHFGVARSFFLVLLYALAQFSFCAAWHVLLNDRLSFFETFLAYSAGDALNMTIPSANLAGEPVKVMLIRDKISFEFAMSSVTVYKFSDLLSLTLFLLVGWVNHFWFYALPISWNIGAGIVVAGMGFLSLLLYSLQKQGIYRPTGKWFEKIGLGKWIVNRLASAHLIDREIATFYQNQTRKFLLSLFFNFLAWFGGVIEIVIFMVMSGLPVSFAAALTIETFSLFINNVIFFVPARLGVGEGGRVLLFLTLGYSATAGISYGIIRRIRELAWIAFGIVVLLFRKRFINHSEI